MNGILQRVTPHHYNLYNEEERLIGSIHRRGEDVPDVDKSGLWGAWYGTHVSREGHESLPYITGSHGSRHEAAQALIEHDQRMEEGK